VLGILSRGEVEARAFVIGTASGSPVSADVLETTRDAARLAVRLRALALMLCAMLAQALQFTLPGAPAPRVCRSAHRVSGPALRWLAAPPAPDTS